MAKWGKIGAILRDRHLISQEQIEEALRKQAQTGLRIGRILVDLGYVREEDVLAALGLQQGLETVSLKEMSLAVDLVRRVPAEVVDMYQLIPISFAKGRLKVAVADVLNLDVKDELQYLLGCPFEVCLASLDDILAAKEKYYHLKASSWELSVDDTPEEEALVSDEAPVVQLVNHLLTQAVRDGASDMHIEPYESFVSVRYRVDGMLFELRSLPKSLDALIVSRLKVMASLDITETRLPQDGRIPFSIGPREVDLRISTLPTVFGEMVVIRVLDQSHIALSLSEIGLSESCEQGLRRALRRSNGVVLVTGPTGSGKTTTLYACLKELNDVNRKIITTEDPIEYDIYGVMQVAMNPKISLTFAKALRHILRQDPDVIMVGEIRDYETVQMTVQSALTGHLVLSTLHTNDSVSTVTRLMDMGIEPFLMTATLQMVVAQRLVRVLCPYCKRPDERQEFRELLELGEEYDQVVFYCASGCKHCSGSGYKGRVGLFEVLLLSEHIRELILKRASTNELREVARKEGLRLLREDGLVKATQGVTSLDEILKVTQGYV